jgi:hypothetical protein
MANIEEKVKPEAVLLSKSYDPAAAKTEFVFCSWSVIGFLINGGLSVSCSPTHCAKYAQWTGHPSFVNA